MIGWDSYLRGMFPESTLNRREPGDRFIPSRSLMNMGVAPSLLTPPMKESISAAASPPSASKEYYKRRLEEMLFMDSDGKPFRMLRFQPSTQSMRKRIRLLDEMRHQDDAPTYSYRDCRFLPKAPIRILDAPDLIDNYYLNVVDWGRNNVLAVGLGSKLYLWNADTGKTELLMEANEDDYVASVAWCGDRTRLAIGLSNSDIQLWDTIVTTKVRTLSGHMDRAASLAWNGVMLTSGSRDTCIINHDVKARSNVVSRLRAHSQEVCGLRWSPTGNQLASGGNDNLIYIWNASSGASYLHQFNKHQAAVKALAWCPHQSHVLASGGGTSDRCIKMWNTQTGQCISSTDTQSQVCALEWNRHQKEILSSHGFTQNQLCLWRYPAMRKIGEIRGHTARVLYLAQSPDGTTVASASADETLRFWKAFPSHHPSKAPNGDISPLSSKFPHIR